MLSIDVLPRIVAMAIAVAACITDLRSRRIPNTLTFGAAGAGIAFLLVTQGLWAGATAVGGWFLGVSLFVPFFLVGGLGAGDVKLMGAIGAWLGPWPVLYVALYTALAGGAMAIVVALANGYLRKAFANVRFILMSWRLGIGEVPGMTLDDTPGPKLAYAIPIAVGTGLTLWLR